MTSDRLLTIAARFEPLSAEGVGKCIVDISGDDVCVDEALTALAVVAGSMIARRPTEEHPTHCYFFAEKVAAAIEHAKQCEASR